MRANPGAGALMKEWMFPAVRRSAQLAAALLLWTGVSNAAELSIGISADVTSLDPQYVATQHNVELGWNVFDALTRVDEKARIIPGLATSWRAIDPLTWEFTLRQGVKFHDGVEFTSNDVLFSYARAPNVPGSVASFAGYLRTVASVEAMGPYGVRIRTKEPNPNLPLNLASVHIVSRHVGEHATTADYNSGRAVIGTGPFRFAGY